MVLGAVALELRSSAVVDHDANFAFFFVAIMRSRNFRPANGLDTLLARVYPDLSLTLTLFAFGL